MAVILATGLSSIEIKLESRDYIRCYHRSVTAEVAQELNAEAVVLSPHLNGEEDLLEKVITPLRQEGVRIIFLPGGAETEETKEWVKKLIPWGIYCYVFDPVTPSKIKERIETPGKIKNLPNSIRKDIPEYLEEVEEIDRFVDETLVVEEIEEKKSLLDRFKRRGQPKVKKFKKVTNIKGLPDKDVIEEPTEDLQQVGLSWAKEEVTAENTTSIGDNTKLWPNLVKRVAELESSLEYDELTGLYNRKYFEKWLDSQINQNKQFSIAIIDIDKFKNVNDTYGHISGDAVLTNIGNFFRSKLRTTDIPARYGGEEFIIGLPDTNLAETYNIIDRLRSEWGRENTPVAEGRFITCTFSAGIAEWKTTQDKKDIIDMADKSLYEAKNGGRNKVCGYKAKITPFTPRSIESRHLEAVSVKNLSALLNYRVVSVWNTCGINKASVALELARLHKNVALLEFDLINPELDNMINIPNTSLQKSYNKNYWEIGAGLLTFPDMDANLASKLLYKYRWGIDYLPAGNRLGVNETYSMNLEEYEKLIDIIARNKSVVIDAPTDLNNPATKAAFRKSNAVVVPINNNPFIKEQIIWLCNAGINVVQYIPKQSEPPPTRKGIRVFLPGFYKKSLNWR